MKEISWTNLKRLNLSEIREGECLKVTGEGEMVFYVVVKPEEVMQDRVQGLCGMIDASRGLPRPVKAEVTEETPEPAPGEEETQGGGEDEGEGEPEEQSEEP